MRIDADAEMRAPHVMFDDRLQHRVERTNDIRVPDDMLVAVDRVEIPERCIDCMVERLALAFRKQVRQQPALHVLRKRAQNRTCFPVTAGA